MQTKKKLKMPVYKLSELLAPNFQSGLQKLCALPLTVHEGYRMAQVATAVDKALQKFQTERGEAIKRHGTPIENNPSQFEIKVDQVEAREAFNKDMNAYLNATEVKLPIDFRVVLDPMFCEGNIRFTTYEMVSLEKLVEPLPEIVDEPEPETADEATASADVPPPDHPAVKH